MSGANFSMKPVSSASAGATVAQSAGSGVDEDGARGGQGRHHHDADGEEHGALGGRVPSRGDRTEHPPVAPGGDRAEQQETEQGHPAGEQDEQQVAVEERAVGDQPGDGEHAERGPLPGQPGALRLGLHLLHRRTTSTATSTSATTRTAATTATRAGATRLSGSARPARIAASLARQRTYPPSAAPRPMSTRTSASTVLPQRTPRSGA